MRREERDDPQRLRRRLPKTYIIRLENSNFVVKALSSSVVLTLLCCALLRETKHFSVLAAFSCHTLATLNTRKHLVSRFPMPVRLPSGAPDTLTHPIRSIHQFRGLQLPVRSGSCPHVNCKRSVEGYCSSHCVRPIFRPFSTTGAPLSRGV